jgi:branched-subunit amino acid transport protein
MWKDEHYEQPPEEDKADKIAFGVAMTAVVLVAISTENTLATIIVGLGLYVGIRWVRCL